MTTTKETFATWDRDLKVIFCDLCVKEVESGNRPTTHFNKEGWNNIISGFKAQTGREYTRMQLKNKWDQIKKDWKLWKELKHGSTGLGWDPLRRTIDASEDWWREKLEVIPAAKKFRYNGIDPELEEKLDRMFTGVVALGQHAWTPGSVGGNEREENEGTQQSLDSIDDFLHNDVDVQAEDIETPTMSRTPHVRKRRKSGSQFLEHGIKSLVSSYSSIAASSSKDSRSASLTTALKLLETIPEIFDDRRLYIYATTVLEDDAKRILFLGMPPDRRADYLLFHINNKLAP